jgi:ketosteroid isomerase-like protein
MSNRSSGEQSKTVVDAYYQAGVAGRLREFARYLHPDFTTTAPNHLPWGGFHPGAAFFRDEVLPNLPTSSTSDGSATTSFLRRTSAWWPW